MYEDIQEEARDGFDLVARLTGASARTKDVTVYTDAKVGAELGGVEDIKDGDLILGKRRWGVRGRLDEISSIAQGLASQIPLLSGAAKEDAEKQAAELEKEHRALLKRVPALVKSLNESALVFTLHSLPNIIVRGTHRKAKDNLGIKSKNVPEDAAEEYALEYGAILLAESTTKYVDNASGRTIHTLTVQDAHNLKDYLPAGEYDKLDHAMYKLSMEVSIGKNATDDLDF